MVLATNSQVQEPYDPWEDINGDGIIDVFDVVSVTNSYDSVGDPTRNVNVANLPLDEYGRVRVSEGSRSSTTYKTVEEITILDSSRIISGDEQGMFTFSDNCAFGFSPKESFLNVTRIVGNLYCHCDTTGFRYYQVQINGLSWTQGPGIDQVGTYVMHSLFGCEEPSVLDSVKPGINILTLDFLGNSAHIMKVVLLIEYYYEA
jgi:hypothetical protein